MSENFKHSSGRAMKAIRTIISVYKSIIWGRSRISRGELAWFLLWTLALEGSLITLMLKFHADDPINGWGIGFHLFNLLMSFVAHIKRIHDFSNSSFWWIFGIILFPPNVLIFPIYFLTPFILLKKGTVGPNQYGADPLALAEG